MYWNGILDKMCKHFQRRDALQLKFVDRFHLSSEPQEWCIMELLFGLYCTGFPLFCLCLISCIYEFLMAVSVSFCSAFSSFCWFRFLFSSLIAIFTLAVLTCLSSFCFPPVILCPLASRILLHLFDFLSVSCVFPSSVVFWNEVKTRTQMTFSRQAA